MAQVNQDKLNAFVDKMVGDVGAAYSGVLVGIGDRLGLYKALAKHGPLSASALAEHTDTAERYVREWLAAMAASDYVTYDEATELFSMTPEQAMVFADDDSPVFMPGAFEVISSAYIDAEKVKSAFRTGKGIAWGDHHHCLFRGAERFFRPGYAAYLVDAWLPALDGVVEKLERGARVADVGCGHGASTILLAKAFPNSAFFGFDPHAPSIEHAQNQAKAEGVDGNTAFVVSNAKEYPGHDYDLVACFDCLHEMGDPAGASRHVRRTMAEDGTWMIVEPFANNDLAQNLNPVGRIYYSASTMICTPASLSQEVGLGLGAQAGEARLREVVTHGGFSRFRRATETPFSLILEARP